MEFQSYHEGSYIYMMFYLHGKILLRSHFMKGIKITVELTFLFLGRSDMR